MDRSYELKTNINPDKTYVVYLTDLVKIFTKDKYEGFLEIELGDYYEEVYKYDSEEEWEIELISILKLNRNESYVFQTLSKAHESVEKRLYDFCY